MATSSATLDASTSLLAYVPALLGEWAPTGEDPRHMRVSGTVAFVDISGFTRLTERLARKGKVGAEEMSDILSATFAELLEVARQDGADLVKWGGDAVLLLFTGADHPMRAARAAHRMRAKLKVVGRLATTSGTVVLRMSVGIHSGEFDFFLVGDPELHRELLISGPAASITAEMEAAAAAGEIGLSSATAGLLDPHLLGPALGSGRLLRLLPTGSRPVADVPANTAIDPLGFLPAPIRAHLLGGETEPEHRLITVAFVQFSGTDELLASAGPAALAGALDDVVRNVQHACADHGVTFFETDINRDGGKVMLTAGAPRSADHDEERMLRVARQILDRAGRLPLRVGINRGHVFAGDFGPAFRRTFSVKGDAINLAARVMGKAVPGQALATTEVTARSQTLFATTELPPFYVKGKSQPVHAVALGAMLGARTSRGLTVPLVGRQHEMGVLERSVDALESGVGRLVEIAGEPGIGKSRLVAELVSSVGSLTVLQATCEQYESSTAYYPFRTLLRAVLGVVADAGRDEVAAALLDQVTVGAPHLLPWLPLLGIPLDVDVPPTPETDELGVEFRKARLQEAVTDLITSLLPGPAVLVIEDVHLIDAPSADLLQELVEVLDQRPWLIVVTRRDEASGFRPDVTSSRATSVRPPPLAPAAALQFVQLATDAHPMPNQRILELVRRGGGNPMFLEALVLDAVQSGAVEHLPESVEALVMSKIDRLDPGDRSALRYAAVLGTTVDRAALDALLREHEMQVPAGAMERLGDFLLPSGPGFLRFRNGLIRDVAYEGLPFRSRMILHDQVGRAVERASATPESQCEVLSLHFFHAGRHDQAQRYSLLAGERALAKFAHGEAVTFFARAAESTVHTETDAAERARVYGMLADSQWLLGLLPQAAQSYAEARRHLRGDPVGTAAIVEKEARIEQRRRRHALAMRRISRGLHELERVPGTDAQVARSLLARRYAHSRFSQGRTDDALQWAERAAREAEEAVDKDALAQAYEMLNFIHAGSGREERIPYGRLALQAYLELGNLPRQGHCLNNLATQDYAAGRWDESVGNLRRATDIFRRIGDTASEGNALYNQAELLVRQGRHPEAAAVLPDVLRIARAVEDDELVALAQRELARTKAAAGDIDGAVTMLHETVALFVGIDEAGEARATELALAEVLLHAGRLDDAGQALQRAAATTAVAAGATAHRLLARWHRTSGDLEVARSHALAGLAAAEESGDRYEQALLLSELGVLHGDGDERDAARRQAAEIRTALGVVDS